MMKRKKAYFTSSELAMAALQEAGYPMPENTVPMPAALAGVAHLTKVQTGVVNEQRPGDSEKGQR
jgi:hypothetical protein